MPTGNLWGLDLRPVAGGKSGSIHKSRTALLLAFACLSALNCLSGQGALAKEPEARGTEPHAAGRHTGEPSAAEGGTARGGGEKSKAGAKDKPKVDVPADMAEAIDQYVLREAKTMGGVEYAVDREIGRGKMSSCFADCYVVLFLLEGVPSPGSKNSTQYMAAFTYNAGKPIFLASAQVGGRGLKFANIKSIGPELIKLSTETYLPKDDIANPTGHGHASYSIADKHIIEVPWQN